MAFLTVCEHISGNSFSFTTCLQKDVILVGKQHALNFFGSSIKMPKKKKSNTHPYLQNTFNMNYDFCLLHLSFADVEQDRKSAVEVHADVVLHLACSYTVG